MACISKLCIAFKWLQWKLLKVRRACDLNGAHSAEQRICMKPVWEEVNNQRIVNVPLSNAKAAAFTLPLFVIGLCRDLVTM